jgi:hypothetical protein
MGGGGGGGIQETQDQIQQQKNNVKLWDYYSTSYKPYIDKFITKETGNAKSGAQSSAAAGKVNASVMEGVAGAAPGENATQIARRGNAAADIKSKGTTSADAAVRAQQMSGLQNIVDIGRGQQTQAMGGQGQLAEQSVQKAIADEKSKLMAEGAEENAIGSGVGAAAALGTRALMSSNPAGASGSPSAGTGNPTLDANFNLGASSDTFKWLNPDNPPAW